MKVEIHTDKKAEWLFLESEVYPDGFSVELHESAWDSVAHLPELVYLPSRESMETFISQQKSLPWVTRKVQFCDLLIKNASGSNFFTLLDEIPEFLIASREYVIPSREEFYFSANDECVPSLLKLAERMGFKEVFWIVSPSQLDRKPPVFSLGQNVQMVPSTEVTQLRNTGDVFFHAFRNKPEDTLSADLSFLSFVRPNGIFVDLTMHTEESNLLGEAEILGLSCVSSKDVRTAFSMFLNLKILKSRPRA
jgi:hypothetical protein